MARAAQTSLIDLECVWSKVFGRQGDVTRHSQTVVTRLIPDLDTWNTCRRNGEHDHVSTRATSSQWCATEQ
jgi:hypothetical protein